MTDLAHGSESTLGRRVGRLAFRLLLVIILASPIGVGFWLAPKAEDMPPPPELGAPPSVTALPDAVRRVLPTLGQDQTQSQAPVQPASLSSGG